MNAFKQLCQAVGVAVFLMAALYLLAVGGELVTMLMAPPL